MAHDVTFSKLPGEAINILFLAFIPLPTAITSIGLRAQFVGVLQKKSISALTQKE